MKSPSVTRILALAFACCCFNACTDAVDSSSSAVGSTPSPATTAWQASAEREVEAIGTVQRLFDALETGDEALLRSVVDEQLVMHFTETRDGNTTFGSATVDGLAERITSSEVPLIERMWDPIVMANGSMTTVWTPYDFYAGAEFSHCGVDVATVMSTDDGPRIVALSWTRLQPPACEPHPDGPPAQ